MDIKSKLKEKIIILDGAMGTQLQENGLKLGENPEVFNIKSPDTVQRIHENYFRAGSNVVLSNTFGANEKKLATTGYTVEQVIEAAVSIAKKAAEKYNGLVGLDVGPIGELLEPMGTLSFEQAYDIFKRQMIQGEKSGADAIFIETMTDLYEMKAALLAAKENTKLPVFCTMSFEQDMRTFTGCGIQSMALTLEGLGADAIGINCSLGPVEMLPMVKELRRWTTLPLVIKPNAGLPVIENGVTTFNITKEEFACAMGEIIDLGVSVVGGCCGTNPDYIAALSKIVAGKTFAKQQISVPTAVCSHSECVEIDRVRVIGERINPTGKKLFKEALLKGDIDYIVRQAIEQVEAGADILDVNVGLPGINEKEMMVTVIKKLQGVVNTPLQIDSSDPQVIEAALRVYNGKPIVNSVNGEAGSMAAVLPLVKKYGAAVVGLTLDENGIPRLAQQRFEIAEKIMNEAVNQGIRKEDVFIDCLTLTSSAEQETAYETLEAVRAVKEKLGLKTVLGVSNISFGLPAREVMNHIFLTLAMANGLDLPIINPNAKEMMDAVVCYHQLKNIDKGSEKYIERFSAHTAKSEPQAVKSGYSDIGYCISKGLKEETKTCCENLLETMQELEIVSQKLIPALDEVGKAYEKNEIFLPQLIQSAEAAKGAFELVRASIAKKSQGEAVSRGKIVIATVKGDIHDIGKNIVKVVLENYGYDVIDLGKDVAPEKVAQAVRSSQAGLVGLSALMTTTLKSMEETIELLHKENLPCKIVVGGAVLTEDYAQQIKADYYAKDAQAAVEVAKQVFAN